MSQTYQARRRTEAAPAEAFAHSRVPQYGRQSGGEADGGTYSGPVPLSASAVPASAAGPMQAKKDITKAKEQAALEGGSIPSIFHPSQRAEAKQHYLDKWNDRMRMSRLAADALGQGNAAIDAANEVYRSALDRYTPGMGLTIKQYEQSAKFPTRYLQSCMKGRGEEEQRAMLEAFGPEGSQEKVAPFLIQDIRKYGGMWSDKIVSENDEDVLNTYASDAQISMRQAEMFHLAQFIPEELLVGEGKLTQEELDRFKNNPYATDVQAASHLAFELQEMGSDSYYRQGLDNYGAIKRYQRSRRASQS